MIITLSPAKMMHFAGKQIALDLTEPLFKRQRDEIMSLLMPLSIDEIIGLMNVQVKQAYTVSEQLHQFFSEKSPEGAAALTYNGMAYKGLNFESLNKSEMEYAQQHLLITSAVYGFLRPLDKIKAYRLELQASLKNSGGKDLYGYWGNVLTEYFSKRLLEDDRIWLNLSSDEYAKVIQRKLLPSGISIITPQFKEEGPKGYRQVVVHTKKARGTMARFVIQHQIKTRDELCAFDLDGYVYAEHLSKRDEPVFIR
ncbi:MAG: YaaA family protein [Dysgonamonadaceae bacterium]